MLIPVAVVVIAKLVGCGGHALYVINPINELVACEMLAPDILPVPAFTVLLKEDVNTFCPVWPVVLAKIFQNEVPVVGAANPVPNVVLAAVSVNVFLEFTMANVVA
jgi:hypothetical protein